MSDQTRTENAIEIGKMYMLLDAANKREAALREELDRSSRLLRIIQSTLPHLEAKNADSVRHLIKQIDGVIGSPKEVNENA